MRLPRDKPAWYRKFSLSRAPRIPICQEQRATDKGLLGVRRANRISQEMLLLLVIPHMACIVGSELGGSFVGCRSSNFVEDAEDVVSQGICGQRKPGHETWWLRNENPLYLLTSGRAPAECNTAPADKCHCSSMLSSGLGTNMKRCRLIRRLNYLA